MSETNHEAELLNRVKILEAEVRIAVGWYQAILVDCPDQEIKEGVERRLATAERALAADADLDYVRMRDQFVGVPMTWFPGLLCDLVERAYAVGVFQDGGASGIVEKLEKKLGKVKRWER